nr:phosphopantetheine-binding protein [Acidisphaera rubrifaciens]
MAVPNRQSPEGEGAHGRSADGQSGAEHALAELIVAALQLEVPADAIVPDAPLFGKGLGLDSIDALEMALAISRTYGFELRSDDERNHQIFASLRSLAAHIEANRTR